MHQSPRCMKAFASRLSSSACFLKSQSVANMHVTSGIEHVAQHQVSQKLTTQMLLQAKPFISEAHVFNDAGVSFDVWPPTLGPHEPRDSTDVSTGKTDSSDVTAVLAAANEEADKLGLTKDDEPLPLPESCQADYSNPDGTCPLTPSAAAASDVSHDDVIAAAVPHNDIQRGFHLAVKLWQEALKTFAEA